MNINDTNQMKERIDSVLKAATEFGTQAKQLQETRTTVSEFVKQAQENSRQLAELTSKNGALIDEMEALLKGGITRQIEPEIEKVHNVINECKAYFSKTTDQYREALKQLEASKDIFADQHKKAEKLLNDTVSDLSSSLDEISLSFEEKLQDLNNMLSDLSQALDTHIEENTIEQKRIFNANKELSASIGDLKEQQRKDTDETKRILAASSKQEKTITIIGFIIVVGLITAFFFLK